MSIEELAQLLQTMYDTAPLGYKVTMIHLFGIRYAEAIGSRARQIVAATDLPASYATEVSKGRKLARYVCCRE